MNITLDHLTHCRRNFILLLEQFDHASLVRIPQGFNNNIIWNFGHNIITQQMLCYRLSGLDMHIDEPLMQTYRKGSKPDGNTSPEEVALLKNLATSTLAHLKEDIENERFKTFNAYPTSYGVTLNNFEEALRFNLLHENLHLGYAMALRKCV